MARIACFLGNTINGVAQIHTEILKYTVLRRWHEIYPTKIINITNGINHRRWIGEPLKNFLNQLIGAGWIANPDELSKLYEYQTNPLALADFAAAKRASKENLARQIKKREGIEIDSGTIFDVQVKRFHLYKRQLLNAMRILYFYDRLKNGDLPNFYPTTFIFGGKAADSYDDAKQVMQLIRDIAHMVNNDPAVNGKMRVVLVTNFNVSYSEYIYPAADFSEEISQAGTEASGTGNMKKMLNGAVTVGAYDGANVEIFEAAGEENNYPFGATVDVLRSMAYNHERFLHEHPDLKDLIKYLKGERPGLARQYWNLANMLQHNDTYNVMLDLPPYIDITLRAMADYSAEKASGDLTRFTKKQLLNVAAAGRFSSDRTVREYAEKIWRI